MRASRRVTVRGQLWATPASWVTMRMVALRRLVEVVDEAQDFGAGVGVEIAGGLVGEEDGRLEGQGAGDGDALALAAGELVGQVVEAVVEADELEQAAGARFDFLAREAFEVEREGHVLDAGERGEEVEELEDEADFVAAEAGEVVIGERGDGLAVDADFAGGGAVEAADQVEEGGLSGAGGADDGDHFAAGDVEVDGIEGDDLSLAVEMFGDGGQGNHQLFG